MKIKTPIRFKKQPSFLTRIVLLIPLTLVFWGAAIIMCIAAVILALFAPLVVLFGTFTYSEK